MPFFDLVPEGLPEVPEGTIIRQYANSETMNFLIDLMDTYFDPTANIQSFYDNMWNLNTCGINDNSSTVNYGLDVWGRIVGITRYLDVAVGNYVGFIGPGGASGLPWNDSEDVAVFYTGGPVTSTFALTNQAFRTLIFAKALYNISDCSAPSINRILNILFGPGGLSPVAGQCYVLDNQDMTMQLVFGAPLTPIQLSIAQSGVIPRPAGVQIINPPRV